MAKIYAELIKKGLRTLDSIKDKDMREQVREILENEKKGGR